MPFEEWTYGTPPADVEFVRINGNRVIRVELAQIGKPPVIFTDDVVSGMLRSDGKPVNTVADATRISRVGDVQRDPDKQSAAAPPTLGKPNAPDPLDPDPIGTGQNHPVMRPVQRPLPHTDDSVTLGANPDDQPAAPSQPSSADAAPGYPATGPTPQPPDADQTPPAGAHLLD